MGIDIDAKLIYGCNYSDLPEEILEEVNEMLDNGELDYASPYYDAPRNEWIVGVEVYCYETSYVDLIHEITSDIAFPSVMQGLDLKFYVTPNVW